MTWPDTIFWGALGLLVMVNVLIESRQKRKLVCLTPSLEEGSMSARRLAGIREMLASLSVPVVDLMDTFDGRLNLELLRVNPYDVHPNTQAHAIIYENLRAKLLAQPDVLAALVGADPQNGKIAPAF